MTRSWEMSSSAWLSTGVPVSARRRPPADDAAGQAAHGLRALRARVLDVVGLVDDERARAHAGQLVAVGGDDLVVEDRDVAGRRRPPSGPR